MHFKVQLKMLFVSHEDGSHNHRQLLAYGYIPVIERECLIFQNIWNSRKRRQQKGLELPTGRPKHMFSFPEKYDSEFKGYILSAEVENDSGLSSTSVDPLAGFLIDDVYRI